MANGQNGNRLPVLDFEQRHATGRSNRDDDFADKRVRILGLATGERKFLEDGPRTIDNVRRPLCGLQDLFCEEPIQRFEFGFRFQCEADAEGHSLRIEAPRIPRSESITSSFDAYCPEALAESRAASPRAMNSLWSLRCSICRRSESSTKLLSDSPSRNTLSASFRRSGVTLSGGIVADFMAPSNASRLRCTLPQRYAVCNGLTQRAARRRERRHHDALLGSRTRRADRCRRVHRSSLWQARDAQSDADRPKDRRNGRVSVGKEKRVNRKSRLTL